ncbi:calcium-binding protein [Phenylobacterium sp.]|uniref:calcium-binding protein n=1 Tax=Phenylobacterium sp. TaxID=1871053 RepID=UPI0025CED772|nr:calcium-binding protein [Phenylobacterium sp.]
MGQVVPFIARVRDSGDWTAAERARLEEVADRLAQSGVHVEVIFGATDDGDPWCVVTDEAGDVLIHVARIDGKFVVHSAVDDAINEGADLHSALRDQLDVTEAAMAPQSATILPFGLTARQGQTFLALVAAAAFFHETSGVADTAHAAELPPELVTDPTPPPPDADAPAQERELATQGAAQQPATPDPAPTAVSTTVPTAPQAAAAPHEDPAALAPPATPEPVTVQSAPVEQVLDAPKPAVRAEPPILIQGTDGDEKLVGASADEHIVGGAGNDTLSGGGGHDLLEGGAGNDRIELTSGVTAVGGEGADTFVIEAPVQLGHANTLLGVILDFSTFDGDKIVTASGRVIELPLRPATDGKTVAPGQGGEGDRSGGTFTGQGVDPTHPTLGPGVSGGTGLTDGGTFGPTLVGPPLTRVEIDFDGDGVMDGYILVGRNGHIVGGADNPVVVTGHALTDGADLFG